VPDFRALLDWTSRQVKARAETDTPVAYLTLCPREGSAYPSRGRLDVDAAASGLDGRLLELLTDIAESAAAEDRPCSRVKVRLYSAKGLDDLGARTFVVDREDDSQANPVNTREGELVLVVRELRLGMASQHDLIRAQTAAAFTMAADSMKQSAALQLEKAELVGALAIAEQNQRSALDKVMPVLEQAIPVLMMKLNGGGAT